MHRHILHTTAALLAFTVGFLTTDRPGNLIYALPLALSVFVFANGVPRLKLPTAIDSHKMLVAAITFILWIPLLAVFLPLIPHGGLSDCEPYYDEVSNVSTEGDRAQPGNPAEPVKGDVASDESCVCGGKSFVKPQASVYAGVLNKKAVSLPAPLYPPLLKSASVKGAVVVSVIEDTGTGEVVWAEAISGHPLLRQAARDAACKARFNPMLMSGKPVLARGILTYNFTL